MTCADLPDVIRRFDTTSLTELNAVFNHLERCPACLARLMKEAAEEWQRLTPEQARENVRAGRARGYECRRQMETDPEA